MMESATAIREREEQEQREREAEELPRYDEPPETGPPPVAERERGPAHPVAWFESLGIFVGFGFAYTLVGFWVLADLHVVNFDALDRLSRALMVWYNDPPKLAAIGFSLPPVSTFVLVPFTVVRDFVTSGLALPLSSALFGAGALVFVNRMFAAADMTKGARLLIVLLVGVNPMFAYYSMNGTGDAAYMFGAAFGLFCLIGWGRSGSARYLIGAGLAFAFAALAKYEFLIWALAIGFLVAWSLEARDRSKEEVEGSAIAYLAPVGYAFGIWIFFNWLVLGDPFEWIALASDIAPVNATAGDVTGFALGEGVLNSLRAQLIFPATLVAIPFLLANGSSTGQRLSYGFAILIGINILYSLVGAAIEGSVNLIELRDALPGMLAGLAALAWLYLTSEDMRPMLWGLTILLAVIALPTAWSQMKTYPHQDLEEAFTRAISTGEDQEGTISRGGFQVGIDPEQRIAQFIREQEIPDGEILTDNSRTYGVIDLVGRPELFFDRVDRGDSVFRDVLANPQDKVEYFLVERSETDLLLERYPGAVEGEVPFLEPVVSNDRYALLRVLSLEEAPNGASSARSGNGPPEDGSEAAAAPQQSIEQRPAPPVTDQGSAPPVTQGPPPSSER